MHHHLIYQLFILIILTQPRCYCDCLKVQWSGTHRYDPPYHIITHRELSAPWDLAFFNDWNPFYLQIPFLKIVSLPSQSWWISLINSINQDQLKRIDFFLIERGLTFDKSVDHLFQSSLLYLMRDVINKISMGMSLLSHRVRKQKGHIIFNLSDQR